MFYGKKNMFTVHFLYHNVWGLKDHMLRVFTNTVELCIHAYIHYSFIVFQINFKRQIFNQQKAIILNEKIKIGLTIEDKNVESVNKHCWWLKIWIQVQKTNVWWIKTNNWQFFKSNQIESSENIKSKNKPYTQTIKQDQNQLKL